MDLLPSRKTTKYFPPFDELTKLLYGEPGTGKTMFAGKAPDSFFLATEPGHDFVDAPVKRIYRWAPDPTGKDTRLDFQTMVRAIYEGKKEKSFTYRTVIIDIVDNLYAFCLNHVCQSKGIDYPPENDFGRTWKEIREEWERWLRALLDAVSVTFITHCTKDKVEVAGKNGIKKEIERQIPTFKGNKPAQFLDGVINCMGFVHRGPDSSYQITFKGDPALCTKDRTNILEALGVMELDWAKVDAAYTAKAKELGIEMRSKWT